jgi:hypothetical protein
MTGLAPVYRATKAPVSNNSSPAILESLKQVFPVVLTQVGHAALYPPQKVANALYGAYLGLLSEKPIQRLANQVRAASPEPFCGQVQLPGQVCGQMDCELNAHLTPLRKL